MFKIGDTVKVISKTNNDGEMREYFPVGTICTVVEIGHEKDGSLFYK